VGVCVAVGVAVGVAVTVGVGVGVACTTTLQRGELGGIIVKISGSRSYNMP
jgi:hypothetical protein